MASFNPHDSCALVVTGRNIYKYYKITDNTSMKAQHNKLTKKETNFSTQYNAHTWTDNRLIIYTERGEVLLADTNGDFKMLMSESPLGNFNIKYAINSQPNGFIIADNNGHYLVYEETNDPKNPFKTVKNLVSITCLIDLFIFRLANRNR